MWRRRWGFKGRTIYKALSAETSIEAVANYFFLTITWSDVQGQEVYTQYHASLFSIPTLIVVFSSLIRILLVIVLALVFCDVNGVGGWYRT